ncbi:Phage tail tape measure protein [hydrothermal vent metagenome]|uniref:Phage tail tape measure protein n=1 Tax=hydrothermal vent metagenome TaxID=652676 RepID=A0A3B0SVG8_9ZZZZ
MAYQMPIDRMTFGDRLANAFRERQIYVRSEGHVRFITLRPWVQIGFVLVLMGLGGWIAFVTLSVAFKDNVIASKKRQYASMQTVYEDRITDMLSSMDQVNGRLLLNQDSVDSRLDTVRQIQGALETRQRQIATLMSQQFGVSVSELIPAAVPADTGPVVTEGTNGSRILIQLEPRSPDTRYSRVPGQQSSLDAATEGRAYRRLKTRLRQLADAQKAVLGMLEAKGGATTKALEKVIAGLGFKPSKFLTKPKRESGIGGPLILIGAFDPSSASSAEEQQIVRIDRQQRSLISYRNALLSMPVRPPMSNMDNYRVSSMFGARNDPFKKVRALHTGLDLPRKMGTLVRATASGKVKRAGWAGAYGRLIEITHDNGLSTRYAHLSKINIKVGQVVKAGQAIGRVGSSGRSTGPHLHYETRVNGLAANPRKYLSAGKYVLK